MIIDNPKLLNQLWQNPNLQEYDTLDLNNQKILDELINIKNLNINFNSKDNFKNIESTIKQLDILIDKCPNIELVNIFSFSPDSNNININFLISKLIKHNINRIVITGFNYDYLALYNEVIKENNHTKIYLDKINDPVNGFTYVFGKKKLREQLNFKSYGNNELNNLYQELHYGKISLKNYDRYKNYLTNYNDLYISIGNVNDLNLNKLESIKHDTHIKGIYIKCGYEEGKFYSIEEYENIRKIIDNIIKMIKIPKNDDPNREKLIFAQIYKILGKNINYDYYAISDEGSKDEKLSCDCRNLKNGLLGVERNNKKELLTVCAGYATILQNLCACFNIKCDYISSSSKEIEDPNHFTLGGTKKYENGTSDPRGHAYNSVYLDGKAYFCDLTWDANLMKIDKLGNYFLKSYDEFYKSHKNQGFSSDNVTVISQNGEIQRSLNSELYIHSCSAEEQLQLFGNIAKGNIEEMISENYLADFVMKNMEYTKQIKGKIGMLEYIKLIQKIHKIEQYIKSSDFQKRANQGALAYNDEFIDDVGNIIEKKSFIFYPGEEDLLPNDAVNEVINMEEKQWKIR